MKVSYLCASLASPLLALLLSLGAPHVAHAADLGNDEVALKNGGSVRGTVVSSEPGTSVKIIELGSDKPRVIPWTDVTGVTRDKYASAPPSAPSQPPPPPPRGLALGAPGIVRLHVESPVPVDVFRHRYAVGSDGETTVVVDAPTQVCSAPCDTVVDGTHLKEFSVVGEKANASETFSLGQMTGDVTLDVRPGSPGLRGGGIGLVSVGGLATGLGIFGAVVGALGTSPSPDGKGFIKNDGLETAGIITLSAGVAVLVGGIVMAAVSGTKIDLHPSAIQSKTAAAKPRYWVGEF